MCATKKGMKLILWQPPMKRVLHGLIPLVIASVYFFGWRSFALLIFVNVFGFLTEYLYNKVYKQPVSSAVFVTNFLFALILPPKIPFWIAGVGIIIGVLFGKMVFGGFGRNIFNPAIVGRAFIYVSFGAQMTGPKVWIRPFKDGLGGFLHWSNSLTMEAVNSATPMRLLSQGENVSFSDMFLGFIPGCIGETSALLILLGGLYIVWKKAANYRIVVSGFLGFMIMQTILWYAKIGGNVNPIDAIAAGGFMFGLFYMATDPISASQTDEGRWIYGAFIGVLTVLIRVFSNWPEGMMFAILLGNMFAPITDHFIRERKKAAKGGKNA